MNSKKAKTLKQILPLMLLTTTLSIVLAILTTMAIFLYYSNKILPNTSIAGVEVGGLTKDEAINKLDNFIKQNEKREIILVNADNVFRIPLDKLNFNFNLETTLNQALPQQQSNIKKLSTILASLNKKKNLSLVFKIDDTLLYQYLSVISGQISTEPINPSIEEINGEIVVNIGKEGDEISTDDLKLQIYENIKNADFSEIKIKPYHIDPRISKEEAEQAKTRAENIYNKTLILTLNDNQTSLTKKNLISLINPKNGGSLEKIKKLIIDLSSKFDRQAQNPTFIFENGRVQEFKPALNSITIEKESLQKNILTALNDLEKQEIDEIEIQIPFKSSSSEFQTSEVNSLGISELLAKGESFFRGSISSRVYNINLAASRLNGLLIKPDEIFSFNQALGDVSKLTGYKEAYIISDGKTVLGDGGGVCQVSTTLFRAALNAGLPIIERRGHSYRVSYYEQGSPVGIDATVYSPTTDLKIKNDTGHHILIQTTTDIKNSKLVFELYGTKDGREVTITKPITTDTAPPPEDLYIDDPSLPAGEIKQIDYKAWGAKVRFSYTVKKNRETLIQKTFYTNYQPWQAKFLRGIGPTN